MFTASSSVSSTPDHLAVTFLFEAGGVESRERVSLERRRG